MDTSTIQTRPDLLINSASTQKLRSQENSEPTNEPRPDNDPNNGAVTGRETVNFSDASLKLAASSQVKNSEQTAMIENQNQAQQALNQLIANVQNNPAQAQAAQGKIFDSAVKSLLG